MKRVVIGGKPVTQNPAIYQVVETDEDYILDTRNSVVIARAASTQTLPQKPSPAEQHFIMADGGAVNVIGGANPIVGGDVVLPNGTATLFTFNASGSWVGSLSSSTSADFLFGNGSDGDIVISAPNTASDGFVNANSFTIEPGGSVRVPQDDHFLLRARRFIKIQGVLNADGTISPALNSGTNITNIFGSSVGGAGGGGGGGGGGGPGGDGVDGIPGTLPAVTTGYGFTSGNEGAVGAGGIGGVGAVPGGDGGGGVTGSPGQDLIDLTDHFTLYPAGPGGLMHGGVPGALGAPGGNGGEGGAGNVPAGLGATSQATGGFGGSNILLVAPLIIINALVSANGAIGANAPNASAPQGATPGTNAPGGSGDGGGAGGGGGGGGGGGAGGSVLMFFGELILTVAPAANPGLGGLGGTGALGGAGDGAGTKGGDGGAGARGATGSPGFVIQQKVA